MLLILSCSDVELEQPIFGANYIKGIVRAQPNGNFVGEAKFKLYFKSGGAIDFGTAMLRAAQMGETKSLHLNYSIIRYRTHNNTYSTVFNFLE